MQQEIKKHNQALKELRDSLDQLIGTAEKLRFNLNTQKEILKGQLHENCECDICLLEQGGWNTLAMYARGAEK